MLFQVSVNRTRVDPLGSEEMVYVSALTFIHGVLNNRILTLLWMRVDLVPTEV